MFALYLWTAAGVLISFVLPPMLKAANVGPESPTTASLDTFMARLKAVFSNRYVIVTVVSLILALVILALLEDEIDSWSIALVSGLGWQSITARVLAPGT